MVALYESTDDVKKADQIVSEIQLIASDKYEDLKATCALLLRKNKFDEALKITSRVIGDISCTAYFLFTASKSIVRN